MFYTLLFQVTFKQIQSFAIWIISLHKNSKLLDGFISGCVDCNREENILAWQNFMKPKISFGLPLEKMDGVERSHIMVYCFFIAIMTIARVGELKSFKIIFSMDLAKAMKPFFELLFFLYVNYRGR